MERLLQLEPRRLRWMGEGPAEAGELFKLNRFAGSPPIKSTPAWRGDARDVRSGFRRAGERRMAAISRAGPGKEISGVGWFERRRVRVSEEARVLPGFAQPASSTS